MVRSQERNAPRWPECSKAGEVLDHAQKDVLAQVLQIDRRHALAIEPADDQGTIQVRQVLPGIRFAGLSAEQQALPGLIHDAILPSPGRAILRIFSSFLDRVAVRFSAARRFLSPSAMRAKGARFPHPKRLRGLPHRRFGWGRSPPLRARRVGERDYLMIL